MLLADLTSYLHADAGICALHGKPEDWAREVVHNIAASGKFSSDRTIHQYATEIWGAKPCPLRSVGLCRVERRSGALGFAAAFRVVGKRGNSSSQSIDRGPSGERRETSRLSLRRSGKRNLLG